MELDQAFRLRRSLDAALTELRRVPGVLLGSALVFATVDGALAGSEDDDGGEAILVELGGGRTMSFDPPDLFGIVADTPMLIALSCVAVVVVFFLRTWLEVGWLRVQADALHGRTPRWSTLWSGADRLRDALLWKVLEWGVGLGVFALVAGGVFLALVVGRLPGVVVVLLLPLGLLPMVVGAAYVHLGMSMGMHAVVLHRCSAREALERSWAWADGHRWHLLWYRLGLGAAWLFTGIVGAVGLWVGTLFASTASRAVTDTAFTRCFLDLDDPDRAGAVPKSV